MTQLGGYSRGDGGRQTDRVMGTGIDGGDEGAVTVFREGIRGERKESTACWGEDVSENEVKKCTVGRRKVYRRSLTNYLTFLLPCYYFLLFLTIFYYFLTIFIIIPLLP